MASTRAESRDVTPAEEGPRSRMRMLWGGAVIAIVLVLTAAGYFAYGLWAARAPEGSGPAYLEQWERHVRARPDDLGARIELAYAYRASGRNARALEQLNTVLKAEPRNAAARYNRGMVYLATGRGDKAEEDLWVALMSQPDHTMAAIALGEYYADKGEYRSLLVAVRPTLDEQPKVAQLHYLVGLGYEHTGHPAWAKARYREALRLDPYLLEARAGLERLGERR